MVRLKVLVAKLVTVNGFCSSAISVREVSSLLYETYDAEAELGSFDSKTLLINYKVGRKKYEFLKK